MSGPCECQETLTRFAYLAVKLVRCARRHFYVKSWVCFESLRARVCEYYTKFIEIDQFFN